MATGDTGRRKPQPKMRAENANSTTASGRLGAGEARMAGELQGYIGRQLRAVYDEIVNEPVPDRFVQLLEELEKKRSDGA